MSDWISHRWYDFCYSISWSALSIGFSLRAEGRGNIPAKGPVLIVGNHESFFDPPVVGVSSHRRLSYLARKTLFKNKWFGRLLHSLKAFPVDQEGIAATGLKSLLAHLERGEAVVMFPEGERTWDGKMRPLKPGVALLIKRAAPPIIPVGIAGAYEALPRGQGRPRFSPFFLPRNGHDIAVSIGKPLDGKRFAEMPRDEMLDALFLEIQKMQRRAEEIRRKT